MKRKIALIFLGFIAIGIGLFLLQYYRSPRINRFVSLQNKGLPSPGSLGDGIFLGAKFLQQGKVLLTRYAYTTYFWDVQTGRNLLSLSGQQTSFFHVSPDEKKFLVANDVGGISIYNTQNGALLFSLQGFSPAQEQTLSYFEKRIISAHFFAQGNKIFTLHGNYQARVWDAHSGKLLQTQSLAFLQPKKILPACLEEWERQKALYPQRQEELQASCALEKSYWKLYPSLSPDGTMFVFANLETKQIELWDVATAKRKCTLPDFLKTYIGTPLFSNDSQFVLISQNTEEKNNFWIQAKDCFLVHTLATTSFENPWRIILSNQKILVGNCMSDLLLWEPALQKSTPLLGSTRQPSWFWKKLPAWLRSKEKIDPWSYTIYIDEKNKTLLVATEEGFYTWFLGKNWEVLVGNK